MTQRQIISCRLNLKQIHHPYVHPFETIACVSFLSFFIHSFSCLPLLSIICDRQSQLYIFIKLKLFKTRKSALYVYTPCNLHTVHNTRGDQNGKKTTKNTHKNDYNAWCRINACEFKRIKASFLC